MEVTLDAHQWPLLNNLTESGLLARYISTFLNIPKIRGYLLASFVPWRTFNIHGVFIAEIRFFICSSHLKIVLLRSGQWKVLWGTHNGSLMTLLTPPPPPFFGTTLKCIAIVENIFLLGGVRFLGSAQPRLAVETTSALDGLELCVVNGCWKAFWVLNDSEDGAGGNGSTTLDSSCQEKTYFIMCFLNLIRSVVWCVCYLINQLGLEASQQWAPGAHRNDFALFITCVCG